MCVMTMRGSVLASLAPRPLHWCVCCMWPVLITLTVQAYPHSAPFESGIISKLYYCIKSTLYLAFFVIWHIRLEYTADSVLAFLQRL